MFFASLNPSHVKIDGLEYPTDGLQIIQLLRGSHPIMAHASGQTPTRSTGESDSSGQWQRLAESGTGMEMLRRYSAILNQKGIPEDLRVQLLDAFATGVLMMGLADLLSEADRYSEELFRMRPDEWTVKGTRGSVLIEMGELEAGARLLREVVENDPLTFDRGIAAAYLALVDIQRGERDAASEWLAKARGFDPHCVPLKRFEKMLNNL